MENFLDTYTNVLENVKDLPTLPAIVSELDSVLRDPDAHSEDVAKILNEDPSLAINILKNANSVEYGVSGRDIASVAEAVRRLGYQKVKALCTTFSAVKALNNIGTHLDHQAFWKHSFVAAVTTTVLPRFCASVSGFSEDEAYMAGLLHDIGVLILDQYFPTEFEQIENESKKSGRPRDMTEHVLLGLDHGEIGAWILRRWNIPEVVTEAVRWHHRPSLAPEEFRPLSQIVHMAEFVCTCLSIGDGGDGATRGFDDDVWDKLGLSDENIPEIIEMVSTEATMRGSEALNDVNPGG